VPGVTGTQLCSGLISVGEGMTLAHIPAKGRLLVEPAAVPVKGIPLNFAGVRAPTPSMTFQISPSRVIGSRRPRYYQVMALMCIVAECKTGRQQSVYGGYGCQPDTAMHLCGGLGATCLRI
jgi:hypothetical protein